MSFRNLFVAAAVAMLGASTAWAQTTDVITLRTGTGPRGTIESSTSTEVRIVANGVPTPVPVNDIVRITFADDPGDLRFARSSIGTGNYEDAIEKLDKITPEQIVRPIIGEDVNYYKAYCKAKLALAGAGDKTAAAGLMSPFTRNANSYHFFEANEIMGDLAAGLGKYENAAQFYTQVGGAPWPEYKLRAAVLTGQAELAKKDSASALKKFEFVLSTPMAGPVADRQKQLAMLGKAVCLVDTNKAQEGIQLVEQVIANGDAKDAELFAKAYNALGACYLKGGSNKDALMAYLHVDMLFYRDPEAHAEALYHLANLWSGVNKSDRALAARNLLKSRYPGSVWANTN